MCSASTMVSSLRTANLAPGSWAVFLGGGGGVGIQGVQLASAMGLRPIVVDTGAERRKLTTQYGAEHFVDFKEVKDPVAEVVKLTDGGAHGVFVTAIQSYPLAMGYLGEREGAKMMCIGIGDPHKHAFTIDPTTSKLLLRNQSVTGTIVSSLYEIELALDYAKRGTLRSLACSRGELLIFRTGKFHLEPTIVGRSQFNESVQKLKRGEVAG